MGIRTAQGEDIDVVLFYFLLFLVARRTIAAPGLVMMREKWRRLWMVPAYHCPQRAVACLPAMHNRLYGHPLGYDRLERACAQRKIGHRFWVTVQLRRTSIVVTGGADP